MNNEIITHKRLGSKVSGCEGNYRSYNIITRFLTGYGPLITWAIKVTSFKNVFWATMYSFTISSKKFIWRTLPLKEMCSNLYINSFIKSLVLGKLNHCHCENYCLCPRQLLKKQSSTPLEMARLHCLRTTACYITLTGHLFQVPLENAVSKSQFLFICNKILNGENEWL